jgi:fibronectin type 3 domain-containing protein
VKRLFAQNQGRFVVAAGFAAAFLCVLSASGSTAARAAPASSPADAQTGLVAAYAFNEGSGTTTADASGGGNTGTLSNTTWTSAGEYGGALSFNGTSARVNIPNAASLQLTTGMTLEAWVNPSTVSNKWRDVIYKGNDNYYLEATSNKSSRPAGGGTFGGGNANVFGTAALAANTWTFLALSYDGSNLRLYVNGTLVNTQPKTGTIATSTNQVQIGGDSLYGQFFKGLIDEVRIYNLALSAAAIQTDMATPVNGSADTQPPSGPGTLTGSVKSSSEVDLSWGAATDNVGVTGYQIWRCQGSGCTSFAQVAQVGTVTTYQDSGRSGSTSYSYEVRAVDAAGNTGPFSNTFTVTTPAPSDTQPPSAPGTLSASVVNGGEIDLSWGAATDNVGVTGYQVWRCQGSGCTSFAQTAQTSGTGTTFKDLTVAASTSYSYEVRAFDAAGNTGPFSNVSSGTTPGSGGLVAAYAFDEGSGTTVADVSGNGNTGTITNATWTTGRYGSGLSFNGTSALVSIPNSASLQLTTGMTLEAWVNPSTVSSAWRDVIYKGDDNYYLEGTSSNSGKPAGGGTFGGANANAFGSAALTANNWSYVALTYDGATLRLYVNGTLAGSQATTSAIATSTNPLQIGGDSIWGQFFAGLIDEIRIYNFPEALTDIQHDMNTPVGSPLDMQPPSAPGTLSGSSPTATEVDLSWGAATDNVGVTGYQIWRCQGSGCTSFAQVAQVGTATTYSDLSVSGSTSYSYEVRALDAAGNQGSFSNTFTITTSSNTDTTPPSAPGTLTASNLGASEIDLSWGAASDNVGVTGYRIDRCTGAGCTDFSHLVQLSGTGTTYKDTAGLQPNTSYSYQVRAMDAAGNLGPVSNTATAVTAVGGGLVAAYSFDEGSGTTVSDRSGNGNNGTLVNATWSASGKYGDALSFNGSNAEVNVPSSSSLQLTSGMTLEAWVDPSSVSSGWRDVIYKGNDNYYLEATSTSGGNPDGGGTFGGANGNVVGSAALTANAWSYLSLTYDGSVLRLYVNGALVSTQSQAGAIATSNNQLSIGGDSIYGQFFAGLIDDVRIYKTAITASQIQADMAIPVGGTPPVPSPPTNLTANVVSGTEVDLTWGPSIDTAGVTGYRVERCQGAGCSNFAEIASPTGTSYNDTSLTPATSYTYRVRAIDANATLGPYSDPVTAFTGLLISPRQASLTPGQTQQFTPSQPGGGTPAVTWSVDGIAGGSSTVGTITSSGVYTAPSIAGTHTITASASGGQSGSATAYSTNYAGTFTFHNDNLRTGQNVNETVLTPINVNTSSFGRLFTRPLDGQAIASPLYVENVSISGQGLHNVVYVATEHDSVYAYDADGRSTTPLWKDSFINPPSVTTVPANDTGECCDIQPEIGITSTPVIDPNTNTMYVVAKTKEGSSYVQRLHALDITTGAEKFGGPVVIQGSVPGSGAGSAGGQVPFDPLHENQRTGLLLLNGVVYFGFASHGDVQPYHGWIFGYNATTLQRTLIFNVTPNQEGAGVWMSGAGLAADATGSIYYITGDGEFDGNTGGPDWGDSYIRMSPAGVVQDYFTPFNQDALNQGNHDLGSGGALLLPDQPGAHPHEMVSSGKDGTIYLVDRDNMGHYSTTTNNIVQSLPNIFPNGTPEPGNFSAPVYWNGYVFFGPLADTVQAFKLTNGLLSTSATYKSSMVFPDRGAALAVSANGSSNGILWAVQRNGTTAPAVLYAFDPANSSNNVLKELWDSSQAGTRDTMDIAAKFTIPLVANGKVFVTGQTQLTAYGLLP